MTNPIKDIATGTIKELLVNISKGFLVETKNQIVLQDYSKHFNLNEELVKHYAHNRQFFNSIYPSIKGYKWGEFIKIMEEYKQHSYNGDGACVLLMLLEELKNRENGN